MDMTIDSKRLSEAETINLDRCYAESDRQQSISRRQQALLAAAGEDGSAKQWAIIRVAPNRENDVDKSLSAALIEHWLPLRKADRTMDGRRRGKAGDAVWMLAWPGYMFVRISDTAAAWQGISAVKHVVSVLGVSERPFFIADAMMLKIKAELATLKDVPANAGTVFVKGDMVRVEHGPFASFNATVSEIGDGKREGRAIVEVMIFGRLAPIELDLAWLSKG